MAANLTPQYYAAEDAYKKAKNYEDKVAALEEMLAVIPKHKGTEKIQGDLKKKLSRLKKEGDKNEKSGKKEDPFLIEKQGAGQVTLIGFPNSGKSSIVGCLTNAKINIAEFPFSTYLPTPGMMPHEDVLIQLIDTPPITNDEIPGNFINAIRLSDFLVIVIDIADDDCMDHLQSIINQLKNRRVLREKVDKGVQAFTKEQCLIIANKCDISDYSEKINIIKELILDIPEIIPLSVKTKVNLDILGKKLFESLNVVRIYTKAPGKKPDMEKPFVIKKGCNVKDFALAVHKEIAENLESARIWGSARFDGQKVQHDYILHDRDIVELNS